MARESNISWTHATFNPIRGCTEVSPACDHCYARELAKRNPATLGVWGDSGTRVVAAEKYWKEPKKWNDAAAAEGVRKRVFCASLADVFEDWRGPMVDHLGGRLRVSPTGAWVSAGPIGAETDRQRMSDDFQDLSMDDVRCRLFRVIDSTPWLDWLLLTKRPENIRSNWMNIFDGERSFGYPSSDGPFEMRNNVWLGATVENQEQLELRLAHMEAEDIAPVRFLSCEPLLGPLDFRIHKDGPSWEALRVAGINWVIAGGESGPNARPSHPDWFRKLRDDCLAAGVAFHHKQNGQWLHVDDAIRLELTTTYDGKYQPYDWSRGVPMLKVGTTKSGRLLDGVLHDAFPEVRT